MPSRKTYAGVMFEIREGASGWFWFAGDPNFEGGAVGVARSENDAVRDACASIDAMRASTDAPAIASCCWERSLASLEPFLACFSDAAM